MYTLEDQKAKEGILELKLLLEVERRNDWPFYLVKLARELRNDPDDRQPQGGKNGQLPGEPEHEDEEEDDAHEVPHQQTELLTQRLAHGVGVRGNA